MKIITIEDCRNLKNKFERYCETAEQYEFIPLTILQMKLDKTLEIIEKDGVIKDQKEARAMFQTILLVIGENADDYKEVRRMTNEEAIEMFKSIIMTEIDRLPHHYDAEIGEDVYDDISKVNELLQLNKIVCKALKKADKYRWHDLRKNPDDLPEGIGGGYESEDVLVMIGTPERNSWKQAYYHHGKRLWSTYEQNVFAWRYIEPFKEEEDA